LSALKEAVDDHDYYSSRRVRHSVVLTTAEAAAGGGRRGRDSRLRRQQQELRQQHDHDLEFFEVDVDGEDDQDDDEDDHQDEEDDRVDHDRVDIHEQVTSTTRALQDAAIAIATASMVSIMSLTLKEKERHIRRHLSRYYDHHRRIGIIGTDCMDRSNRQYYSHDESRIFMPQLLAANVGGDTTRSSFLLQLPWKQRHGMIQDLREIFDAIVHTRRAQTVEFYKLWREWVLQLLSADHCRELQLFGWEQLEELVKASARHRPPPRMYVVQGAGVDFVNGEYRYTGKLTPDGYAYTSRNGSDTAGWSTGRASANGFDQVVDNDLAMDDPTAPHYASTLAALSSSCSHHSYQRIALVPRRRSTTDENSDDNDDRETSAEEEEGMEEKTITLFQCTMQSKQKWWFLSEADEEQPGTDRDIDYYEHSKSWQTSARRQHNGRPANAAAAAARQRMLRRLADEDVSAYGDVQYHDELPPTQHWKTSKDGAGPAPTLKRVGYMVPHGEEVNTLEHQLAQWMLREDILHLAINQSKHCEQVANHYLPVVMKFSATVFELECGEGGFSTTAKGTQLIVQLSQWYLVRNELITCGGYHFGSESCFREKMIQKQLSSSSLSTSSTRSETSFSSTRMRDDDDFIFMTTRHREDNCSSPGASINNHEMSEESIRRMTAISDWLSEDVLLYPKEEDARFYARIFMSVGLDSVDAIMEDLGVEDLDSMDEFKRLKPFHKRRIRQHLLERAAA
jgi:hypothetical protein